LDKLLKDASENPSFESRVQERLTAEWALTATEHFVSSIVPIAIQDAIKRSINSKTKTYRYVLPTQLLAKLVDHEIDCRSVQVGSSLSRSFDARSICHKVIVPFDRSNHGVLGGSTEPYLNNPLRIPAILPAEKKAQKDKSGFSDLLSVLEYAQRNPTQIIALFKLTLKEIKERLTNPNRT
jgi:hypothetical protein